VVSQTLVQLRPAVTATSPVSLQWVIVATPDQVNRVPGIIRGTLSPTGARLDEIFLLLSPAYRPYCGCGKGR